MSEREAMKMSSTTATVIKVVKKVLDKRGSVDGLVLDLDDLAISSVVGELHKARHRMALAREGIVLDFRPSGDLEIAYRFKFRGA